MEEGKERRRRRSRRGKSESTERGVFLAGGAARVACRCDGRLQPTAAAHGMRSQDQRVAAAHRHGAPVARHTHARDEFATFRRWWLHCVKRRVRQARSSRGETPSPPRSAQSGETTTGPAQGEATRHVPGGVMRRTYRRLSASQSACLSVSRWVDRWIGRRLVSLLSAGRPPPSRRLVSSRLCCESLRTQRASGPLAHSHVHARDTGHEGRGQNTQGHHHKVAIEWHRSMCATCNCNNGVAV